MIMFISIFLSCEKDAPVSLTARSQTSVCLSWSFSNKLEGYAVNTYPSRFYVVRES